MTKQTKARRLGYFWIVFNGAMLAWNILNPLPWNDARTVAIVVNVIALGFATAMVLCNRGPDYERIEQLEDELEMNRQAS